MSHPNEIGIYKFSGTRHIRDAQYEHICTVLHIVWTTCRRRELAVQMAGSSRYFPLRTFDGIWEKVELIFEAERA